MEVVEMTKDDRDPDKKEKSSKEKEGRKKKSATAEDVEEEVQQLLKNGVWKQMKEEGTGKTYYYHTTTKETCWDLKKAIRKQRRAASNGGNNNNNMDDGATTTAEPADDGSAKRANMPHKSEEEAAAAKKKDSEAAEVDADGKAAPAADAPAKKDAHAKKAAHTSAEHPRKSKNKDKNDHALVPCSEKGQELAQTEAYRDPLERLMNETQRLEQLMVSSGTSQAMALEFQRSYEALARTNKALTTQMVKMQQEYNAMDAALKEANIKVYEKDLALRELQSSTRVVNKEEEAERTLVFLREQNQELLRQVGELTVALSRGFNELAYQQAMTSDAGATSPDALVTNPVRFGQQESLGATLDRVLTNPLTQQSICHTCIGELEKLRLSLLPQEERATASAAAAAERAHAAGAYHAHYLPANAASAPTFTRFGHPRAEVPRGGHVGYSQQHQHQQQQQQGYFGPDTTSGGWQPSSTAVPPQSAATQYLYSGNNGAYPAQQQQPGQLLAPSGYAYGRSLGGVAQCGDGGDTYADHFPDASMNRRSESRASVVSATPVFGGFRIRPSS
ncbi:hypothetical protein DQ04_01651060 [Trypanosoma grayi]|uniref:hypothetical protein n=1 Tax=Trypanosoma grayi TaxID=71804 RepID=UPI0004F4782D|nr:hypothetical protein DQ04_01651060 [Trypanosoma grayi]KEG12515.1 hypothetical protein DQ04_01651060 [Trypanosoma grayi]